MPYSMCPLCGTMSHLSVGDVKEWYQHYHPEIEFGEIVPHPCFFCWVEMPVGTEVSIRRADRFKEGVKVGDRGIVERVITSKGHSLYEVTTSDGKKRLFFRSELRKDLKSSPNVLSRQ